MEGDEYHRRQYEQHSTYAQGRDYASTPTTIPGSVSDRVRPSQQLSSMRSPTSASRIAAAGATNPALADYAFPHSQQYTTPGQETSLQYQPEFGQDPQRQQQSHFSQYPHNMLYNAQQQAQSQSPYDPVQPFQPRQSAAIEVLSNQFGVSPYYSSGESTSAAGTAPVASQYASDQYSQYQQFSSAARPAVPSSYSAGLPEHSQNAVVPDQTESQPEVQGNDYDAAYNRYLENLGRIFQNVRDGRLAEAAQSLVDVSGWLLGSAVQLGLTRDQQELHSERLKLWKDFNICWLAVLQKQKDITQEILASGRSILPPQSMIPASYLNHMGDKLVNLSDGMESHGLVDYEMGVWEEEIISVLMDCLRLLDGIDNSNQGAGLGEPSSTR